MTFRYISDTHDITDKVKRLHLKGNSGIIWPCCHKTGLKLKREVESGPIQSAVNRNTAEAFCLEMHLFTNQLSW